MKRTILPVVLVAVMLVALWSLPGIAHADEPGNGGADSAAASTPHTFPVSVPAPVSGDADQFFAMDLGSRSVVTLTTDALDNPTIIAPLLDSVFGGDFVNGDYSTLYVVDNTGDLFATIDTSDGGFAVIGELGAPVGDGLWSDATWDETTDTMFASSSAQTGATLYTINLTTGALTVVAPIEDMTIIVDMAVDPTTGQLYGIDISTDNLYRINKTTGETDVVGSLNYPAVGAQGMDFDDVDGILYWAAYQGAANGPGSLRTIDLTTGASTEIGVIGGGGIYELDAFAWMNTAAPTAVTLGTIGTTSHSVSLLMVGIAGVVVGLLGISMYRATRRA